MEIGAQDMRLIVAASALPCPDPSPIVRVRCERREAPPPSPLPPDRACTPAFFETLAGASSYCYFLTGAMAVTSLEEVHHQIPYLS